MAASEFKIGKYHHLEQSMDQPDQVDREIHPEDEEALRAGIRRYFPDANGHTMAMKTSSQCICGGRTIE